MFDTCYKLSSWSVDLPVLENGDNMFYNATTLGSFTAKMPKLTTASNMFLGCVLNAASVLYIIRGDGAGSVYEGIPTYTSGSHPLHLGKRTNYMYSQEVADCFDEKPAVDSEHPLPAGTYHCKGWTITVAS